MKSWEKVRKVWLNFWNWLLDRWFLAKRGEETFHVIGKRFSFSYGPMIFLRESKFNDWVPIEGEYFNEIIPRKSVLRVRYKKTRITKKRRVIGKTVINSEIG